MTPRDRRIKQTRLQSIMQPPNEALSDDNLAFLFTGCNKSLMYRHKCVNNALAMRTVAVRCN